MDPKPQLHQSHLSLLYRCGYKFSRVVLDGEREPPTVPLIVGSSTHTTVARNLQNKIDRGTLLTKEAVQDFARDDFSEEWNTSPVVLNNDEAGQGLQKTRDLAQDQAIQLVRAHHYEIAPIIVPRRVERPWVLEAKDFDYDMAGQIDVDEGFAIRDTKTRKTNLGQSEVDRSEQFTFYALAKYLIDGRLPDYVAQDNIIKPTKTRGAYCVSYKSTRTVDDFKVAFKRFEQACNIIKSGVYTPADPSQWWCSPTFCGFYATGSCPYANNKTRKPITNPIGEKEGHRGESETGAGESIIKTLERIVAPGSAIGSS